MKEKWEEFKGTLTDIVMMSKKEFLLTVAVCILGGIVFGIFFSPKKSTMIASNNGSNNGNGVNKKEPKRRDKDAAKDGIADWQEVEEKELGAEA